MNASLFFNSKPILEPSRQQEPSPFGRGIVNTSSTFCPLIKPMASVSFRDTFIPYPKLHERADPFPLTKSEDDTRLVISKWREVNYSRARLGPGMILLKNFINLIGQVALVDICQKWAVRHDGLFQAYSLSGTLFRRRMTCFGRNWDPITRYKNRYKNDGSEPLPIPYELVSFTKSIFTFFEAQLDGLPSMSPDICLVNYYAENGRYSLHQDNDESPDSLIRGLPVVSISLGDSAEFWYTRGENKLHKVLLETGDVLIFGGESRLIFHGVRRIFPGTCPRTLKSAGRFACGRLNFTLRQY